MWMRILRRPSLFKMGRRHSRRHGTLVCWKHEIIFPCSIHGTVDLIQGSQAANAQQSDNGDPTPCWRGLDEYRFRAPDHEIEQRRDRHAHGEITATANIYQWDQQQQKSTDHPVKVTPE